MTDLWEVQTPPQIVGGYDEGEPVYRDVPADWEAWIVYRRLSAVVPVHVQFASIDVPKAEAERLVQNMVTQLNKTLWL